MENGNKAYVNQMNVKLQSSKYNLKIQMCSAAYWLSPPKLYQI